MMNLVNEKGHVRNNELSYLVDIDIGSVTNLDRQWFTSVTE